jgi:hypothetical protein
MKLEITRSEARELANSTGKLKYRILSEMVEYEAYEIIEDLISATEAHCKETKSCGGYLYARLSDAKDFLKREGKSRKLTGKV